MDGFTRFAYEVRVGDYAVRMQRAVEARIAEYGFSRSAAIAAVVSRFVKADYNLGLAAARQAGFGAAADNLVGQFDDEGDDDYDDGYGDR